MSDQPRKPVPLSSAISWTSSETPSPERAAYILKRARLLLGCYRRDAAADPQAYVATIFEVLRRYPDAMIHDATDPSEGIASAPRWQSFPPTSGELRGWLEEKIIEHNKAYAYRDRVNRQLAEREELERLHDSISPEERAAHVRRVEDELAEHGMFTAGWKRRQREAELARTREATGQTGFVHPKRLLTWREAEIYRAERAVSLKAEADARAAVGRAARAAHASGAEEATPGGVPSKERTHGLPTSRK